MVDISKWEYWIYSNPADFMCGERLSLMGSEIRELNRIICKQCDAKDYERCKSCKVYQLVNKLARNENRI